MSVSKVGNYDDNWTCRTDSADHTATHDAGAAAALRGADGGSRVVVAVAGAELAALRRRAGAASRAAFVDVAGGRRGRRRGRGARGVRR